MGFCQGWRINDRADLEVQWQSTRIMRRDLLTTTTTVCGLIPLWMGGGIMFEPLAVGILFGLRFATVITLLFVPAMYRILYRVSFKNYIK